jgi:hypothetical protein
MTKISFGGRRKDVDTGASSRGGQGLSSSPLPSTGDRTTLTSSKPMARTARRSANKYATAGFFAIFAAVGIGTLYPLSIRPMARTIDAQSWVATPCKVLRAEVRSRDSSDGTTYSVYIQYRYEINGQTYTSDRFDFMGGSSSGYGGKAVIVAVYRSADNPVCYVDPANPSQAVLRRGLHANLLLALFPLPFLLVGFGGAIYTLGGKQTRNAASAQPWSPQPTGAAPTDLTVLRPGDMGRVVLKPRLSPKVKFAGILLAALIWDGIVSVFVFGTVGELGHGDASWFRVLFMLLFVAVGLGLLASAGYQFLSMLNPRPTLDLSRGTIPLGGSAELRWSFTGRTSRIREFTVTLRGTEEATYRKGTNTCTDKNTFYEMELYRTSNPPEIASGEVGFVVPQDTMHSFEADNNKILWSVDIHGRIDRWPDVKESFKIAVVPS